MKNILLLCLLMIAHIVTIAQSDVEILKSHLLSDTPIEENLQELCDEIGGRVTGSTANEQSVEWALKKFQEAGLNAWKDQFTMPNLWLPRSTEMSVLGMNFKPEVVSKYNSPPGSHNGKVVYVGSGSKEELEAIEPNLKGNFWLVAMDLCLDIDGLFAEYAHAAEVEFAALEKGAKGIIFMSSRPNKLLYRFISAKTSDNAMPQVVMSRIDAQRCIRLIESGKELNVNITIDAQVGSEYQSHNVIAEIKGKKRPKEVIIIGAHLDSWAMGTGANDNGANVCLMIDIARQMKKLNIQPDRTIRFALWNGEEQGYFGSWDYTLDHLDQLDDHKMALSVDIGSGAIIGFFTNGRSELIPIMDKVLAPVQDLGPYVHIDAPVVGTDNFDFMLQGVPNLVGVHRPQVYGPTYHSSIDTYDKVDLEQLKKNSAIVAALTMGYANLSRKEAKVLSQQSREEIQSIFDQHNLEFTMRMFNVWESWVNGSRGKN